MTIDPSPITKLTIQVNAMRVRLATVTDPSAKAFGEMQLGALEDQLLAEAQHQQSQYDSQNNLLNGLGLFATLTSVLGTNAPTIINLFK